ncbi:MAG: mechanosensitive ion channel [Geminicoccaceae bacterium]
MLLRLAERPGSFNRGSVLTATRLVRWAVLVGGGLIALRIAGVPIGHIALLFSALSIGLGFGLQNIVNNLVSGLILLGERSIRVGDFLDLPSGFCGVVLDISMRSTRLRTPDGTLIPFPNSVLVGSTVHNLSRADAAHRQRFDFGVGYGTDKAAVHEFIAAAARAIPATIEDADHPSEVAIKDFGAVTLGYHLVV